MVWYGKSFNDSGDLGYCGCQTLTKQETLPVKKGKIWLIEKRHIDKIDGRDIVFSKPFGYVTSEMKAKTFCSKQGYWTREDTLEAVFYPNEVIPKFTYKELSNLDS